MKIRETVVAIVLLLAFYACVAYPSQGCNVLTPAEQAKVAADSVKLSACSSEAHLCKVAAKLTDAGWSSCWDEYEMCMQAHGFRDGGK